ncbi:MAG: hypothetical protein AAGA54_14850 [Myxococcota bacterium]
MRTPLICLLCLAPSLVVSACGDDGAAASDGDASTGGAGTDEGTGVGSTTADATEGRDSDDSSSSAATTSTTADDTAGADSSSTGAGPVGTTPGCGLALDEETSSLQLEVNGETRDYLLVRPTPYDPDQAYPVVFAWHGLTGSGAIARAYYGIEEASAGRAFFLYADGLFQKPTQGTGWDLSPQGDVLLFDAMLERLANEACIDPDRIFSTGHSFGSYFSNTLACYRPDVLRAVGGVAGGPSFFQCEATGAPAAWASHDPADAVVVFEQGQDALAQHLERNGCGTTTTPVEPSPCVQYDDCSEGSPVHWCEHGDGGANGHQWPTWSGPALWTFFASF